MFRLAHAAPAAWQSPAAALAAAERVLARGPTLDDAATLYLVAARPEVRGELRARLSPWELVWPRLPHQTLSEARRESILHAIQQAAEREVEAVAAADVLRGGPDPDAVAARAQDRAARATAAGLISTTARETHLAAERDVREALERRAQAAREHAENARAALVTALRSAR